MAEIISFTTEELIQRAECSSTVMVVRPRNFMFNEETAISNKFQVRYGANDSNMDTGSGTGTGTGSTADGTGTPGTPGTGTGSISHRAIKEFDQFVNILKSKHIKVILIDDTADPIKPDAVFPNNWVTFHLKDAGKVILYPMCAENRRYERRLDAVDRCVAELTNNSTNSNINSVDNKSNNEVIDMSDQESRGVYMEGTGSMLFDHLNKIIYCCLSIRASFTVLVDVSRELGYSWVVFRAVDTSNFPIYHTNVMLAIGEQYSVVCGDSIVEDPAQLTAEETAIAGDGSYSGRVLGREEVLASLAGTDLTYKREVVSISTEQMNCFAGNMLELFGTTTTTTATTAGTDSSCRKSFLMMSQTAYNSLSADQITKLSAYSELVSIPVRTIETYGGGSIRCMICEVR